MDRVSGNRYRGDVWDADFDPIRGHEQAGRRPAIILSTDRYNQGYSELVFVAPLTRTDRGIPWHVPVNPPEGGLTFPSFVLCDQLRVFSTERLIRHLGRVSDAVLRDIEDKLRILLGL